MKHTMTTTFLHITRRTTHQRPLLGRIDTLGDRRLGLELQMSDAEEIARPQILDMKEDELREFAEHWRTDLTAGTMEKRKSIFRQLIDSATFDRNKLHIIPSYQATTGIKVASPRGVEPLLPG